VSGACRQSRSQRLTEPVLSSRDRLAPGLGIAGAVFSEQMWQERALAWVLVAHELAGPGKCSRTLGVVLMEMQSHQMPRALLVLRRADAEARDARPGSARGSGDTRSGGPQDGNGEVREHLLGAPGR
jgi:hypothetical protein